jgi:hypothetical protein
MRPPGTVGPVVTEGRTTWAELGYKNAGIRTTGRALGFVVEWGLATAVLGREPVSVEEFAEVAEESRATAFRNQQAFRKAFPKEETPTRINRVTGAQRRFDELVRTVRSHAKAASAAQPLVYLVGGSPTA